MEHNFDHDEFEHFLQRQVKNQRMFPADSVWREIHKSLHGEKRWPALTIAAFILISATILICAHFAPKPNIFAVKASTESIASATQKPVQKSSSFNIPSVSYKDKAPGVKVENASDAASAKTLVQEKFAIRNETKSQLTFIVEAPASSFIHTQPEIITSKNQHSAAEHLNFQLALLNSFPGSHSPYASFDKANKSPLVNTVTAEKSDKNLADEFLKEHSNDVALHTTAKPQSLKNSFGIQLYVAPSISYRKLSEDPFSSKGNTEGPVGLNYVTDVNNVVRHKPGTGIEAGVSLLYNLTEKIRLKSGLQFNLRQYSIEAYRSSTEIARIALEGNDTINTLAVYRTNNGYASTELKNRFYQLSVPIGIEWQIVGNKRLALNVAGSIQPTYLLNHDTYLLSTNFKNYSENPAGIVRSWNINSNVEAYVSLIMGNFKWQLGPQLRYQPYSSFIKQYPINEQLLDYGFKLGISTSFH